MKKKLFTLLVCLMAVVGIKAQLSTNPDKFLGNITTSYQIDYGSKKFYQLWNQITPENESKWASVEGTRGTYNWGSCNNINNYAKQHGFPFKFHTLVWGSQFPGWVKNLSVTDRYNAIVKWMDAVKKRYPDLEMIDVVNEAVEGHQADTPYMRDALGGTGKTGYDWIVNAFEMAHERWPNAILIYNDFNTFQWNTDQYIDLVRTLRDAGAPIDAYGCQSHDLTDCTVTNFKNAMVKIQNALKMPMYITEYDIGTDDDNLQLQRYKEQIPYMWEASYCAGVTLWGYIYGKTWTTNGNSGIIKNGKDRPAMTWLREYMATDKARQAKSPFPGMKKEASVYVKPASISAAQGDNLPIEVRAAMRTKTIDHVDLYVKNVLVNTMTEAPYITEYEVKTLGKHELKAVVVTTDGTQYERLGSFTAHKQRAPYKSTINLPGTLQFEDFDKGGEGFTFHDSDTKDEGGAGYRTDNEGVDVIRINGGYALGYTADGEWLEYTVNVTKAGTFNYQAVVASGSTNASFTVSLMDNGTAAQLCKVDIPQTADNDWSVYTTVKGKCSMPLQEGLHTLRVTITGAYGNLDKLVFISDEGSEEPAADPNFYVYLCFGQSNMEGNATPETVDKVGIDPRFQTLACVNFSSPQRTMGQWYTATPPIVRQGTGLGMADYFGRTMVKNLPENVRVGVVDVAIGGTKIEGFMQDEVASYIASMNPSSEGWLINYFKAYDNDPYQRLVDMAKIAQKSGVIKGILLHQGESNNGEAAWPQKVKKIYDQLLADLNLKAEETPLFVGETVSQAAGGACWYHNTVVAKVPNVIPNSYVISSADCQQKGDGLHFTAQGYRIMGARYAKQALKLMGIEAEIDEPETPTAGKDIVKRFTSLDEIGTTPFAIVEEKSGKAFYGIDNQNLGFDTYANAFVDTNTGYLFRLEKSTVNNCYLLRLITPQGGEYSIWGNPGYLNSQPADQWCSFILGLNNQNGQDMKNGAVWDIQYVSGKGFSLKNIGTGLYLNDATPAKYEDPVYFNFCTLGTASSIDAPLTSRLPALTSAVYTLQGVKVGSKEQWHTLPHGIYIVDGKLRTK